ncbi:MAG TPA: RluA family pseudouridine synthase [Ktedonobacterales bacterium]|nr:RluA family pseudouridine synthase [Ktedonobacterales bacterium]
MSSQTQIAAPSIPILYEDADLLVVDKPAGLVIHPAYKHPDGTLFNAVSAYVQERGEAKPCLLHRLDKDTSGVILLAKTAPARRHLVRQFEQHTIHKTYLALVCGALHPASGEIDAPLRRDPLDRRRVQPDPQGMPARTVYQTLQVLSSGFALIELHPITGRMHQLRVHLTAAGAPIVGDTLYGAPERWAPLAPQRQCLHAHALTFQHPSTGKRLSVVSPLPADIQSILTASIP